jgi:hypothetical protein
MAGKEIDRERARGALEVVKAHPGMTLFALSPAIIALGAVWWLLGGGWAFVLLLVMVVAGGAAIVLKR